MGEQFFKSSIALRIMLGVIFAIASMTLLGWAEDYTAFIATGDQYYAQFDNAGALEEYKKAYEHAPDDFEVLMKLTRAYNDTGEDLRGIKFRRKEGSKEQNSKKVEEHYTKAVEFAELLQKKYPNKTEPYFLLATAYGHLALFKGGKEKVRLARDVEKNCNKAIELDPNFFPAYIALGIYYREVANLNWALKAFAKTVFGGLPNKTNEDSEKSLLKALALNPSVIHTHFELAKTYERMKAEDKVIKHLKEIVELPISDHQDKEIKAEAEKELRRLVKR